MGEINGIGGENRGGQLRNLIGGQSFVLPCKVFANGFLINLYSLQDTGAQIFISLSKRFAESLTRRLKLKVTTCEDRVEVAGFDGKGGHYIDRFIRLDYEVGGRRFKALPMVILDSQKQDMLVGAKWFSKYDILPDCRRQSLIFPEDLPATYTARKELRIPRQILKRLPEASPIHQEDADRRDAAFQASEQKKPRLTILQRPYYDSKPYVIPAKRTAKELEPLDVCSLAKISTEEVIYSTSLSEIDQILAYRCSTVVNSLEMEEDLESRVPKEYHNFLDVFSRHKADELPPHREYDHKIEFEPGKGPKDLGFSPLWHQTTEELRVLKQYLDDNLAKGFIQPSKEAFASPILFVKKANGKLRFCIDFRKLNALTKKDRYPLPLIDETFDRMAGMVKITKLDIISAFNRIRMHPESLQLTSFRTRYGQYESTVLPFGLCNGPATYQRYMNDVLFDYLDDFTSAYMDDIVIWSKEGEDHEEQVRKVLQRLQNARLQVDLDKCEFGVEKTKFLGFIVGTKGIEVDPEKIQVLKDWKEPKSVTGVRSFLGFCGFYRRFIKDYGRITRPLNNLTKKDAPFTFDDKCKKAMETLITALTEAPILSHYQVTSATMLETDASDGVVSGILSQKQKDDLWKPVAYYTKMMSPAECNYPIHDKEMLAILRAFEQWRAELQGSEQKIQVYSDHKALEYFMTKQKLSARQARWAEFLSRYHFEIVYRPGGKNQKADALSRREQEVEQQDRLKAQHRESTLLPTANLDPRIPIPVDLAPVLAQDLGLIDQLIQSNRTDGSLEPFRQKARMRGESHWTLEDGLLKCDGRLAVVEDGSLRTRLIQEAHSTLQTAHAGIAKTTKILRDRYYWRGLRNDVQQYIRNCRCQNLKAPRDKAPGLLHPLPIPNRPWQHISMDFKEFPEDKKGYNAILVVVDRLGKRPISVPTTKEVTAKDLAHMFIRSVYRYYGPPDTIVSDRGPQFISDFWSEFTQVLGIRLKLSTAEQPQTDGQTEIVNQYIDQRLAPFVNYYQDNWSDLLPMVDFAQAALPHESIGQSPFMTELGYEPRTSFDWKPIVGTAKECLNREEAQALTKQLHKGWQFASEHMAKAQERFAKQANKHRREVDFDVGDFVRVKVSKNWRSDRPSRKLADKMKGPFKITEQVGHSFRLELPDSMKVHPVFHASKLRKALKDPLEGQIVDEAQEEQVNGEIEYDVETILGVRLVNRTLKYKVKWINCDEDPEEYRASDLKNAPKLLQAFHTEYPKAPGPPKNLQYWLDCAGSDLFAEERNDDDQPKDLKTAKEVEANTRRKKKTVRFEVDEESRRSERLRRGLI